MGKIAFSIHPHRGYLNTIYTMRNNSTHEIVVIQDNGNPVKMFPGQSLQEKFSPGEHTFVIHANGQEDTFESIIVEDAIKLGGGDLKKAYVSTLSPWVLVKMTDRTYFHHRETEEEYVEMNLSPEEIEYLSNDHLMFYTRNEGYSIYSISESRIIETFEKAPEYKNGTCVVFRTEEKYTILGYDGSRMTFPLESVLNKGKGVLYIPEEGMSVSIFSLDSLAFIRTIKLRGYSNSEKSIEILNNGICLSEFSIFNLNDEHRDGLYISTIPRPDCLSQVCSNTLISEEKIDEIKQKYLHFRDEFPDATSKNMVGVRFSRITEFYTFGSNIYYRLDEYTKNSSSADSVNSFICKIGGSFKLGIDRLATVNVWNEHLVISQQSLVIVVNTNNQVSYFDHASVIETPVGHFIEKCDTNTQRTLLNLDGELIISGYTSSVRVLSERYDLNILKNYGWVKVDDENILVDIQNPENFINLSGPIRRIENTLLTRTEGSDSYYAILPGQPSAVLPLEDILAISSDGSIMVYQENESNPSHTSLAIYENKGVQSFVTPILKDIYNSEKYRNVLFTADGEHIVYSDSEGSFFSLGLNDNAVVRYDNERFIQHVNGYRSEVLLHGAKPRVINPITGQFLNEAELSQYTFSSPDGSLTVVKPDLSNCAHDGVGMLEYIKVHDNSRMTKEEYVRLATEYNLPPLHDATEELMLKRIKFMKENTDRYTMAVNDSIHRNRINRWKNITVYPWDIANYKPSSDKTHKSETDAAIEYFAKFTPDFLRYVAKVNEYIIIHDNKTGEESHIDLGIPLWFLNYISFSFDQRFVSIVGRYPDNTSSETGHSISGLFLLYDLVEKKIVDSSTSTNAVWVSAFTRDGHIGYYDSTPNTFIKSSACKITDKIEGRNFMTFSPSGKYFALSNQGYIRAGYEKNGESYGHQPSTNVFIRRTESGYPEIAKYNDHGDKISNTGCKSVCMVAFSRNDKHLLSVSNDGVAVVRNLHLD